MTQKMQAKEESIKQLRGQLEHLTNELNKTTEYIQLLEIQDESKIKSSQGLEPEHEISELLQKQNTISHEIILVKKRIQKLSAKAILKIELLILPVVVVLLFFVATNYAIQPSVDVSPTIKTRYMTENLRGSVTDDYKYWNVANKTPLLVTIENNAGVSDQNIQAVKTAIMSTESITDDSSQTYNSASGSSKYFKGWQGAVQTILDTKHYIPERFNIIQSANGEGQIVITLSTIKDGNGYSGVTRTIVDGNQILKSFITIYAADKLTDTQTESIVRHEFGHALGLPHTSNTLDLMQDSISADHSYISACDINALQKLYNDVKPSDDFCKE
ncbi:MAG TPA: matrixin family metalloprotease [Candidatus Nitrosotalea sp.]|nr:matrixin family metalloprotease [Candidatus Nitrosotalea sp.]